MLFKTAASVAILAGAAHAAAEPKPYKLAMMPVLGQSLARRQTNGYIPDEQQCGDGATCAEACGAGFDECPSNDDNIHCFNPQAGSQCCSDGAGNSCDAGYYCTHDSKKTTWCCPDSMDLAACAAAYTITGGLETAEPTTSTPTTTATPSDYSTPETTSTSTKITTTKEITTNTTTTYCPPTSSGYTTAWTGSNSTITSATLTATPVPPVTETPTPTPVPTGAASSTAVSMLLLVAAGAVALL